MTDHRTRRLLVAAVLAGAGLAVAACDGGGTATPAGTETVTVAAEGQPASTAAGDAAATDAPTDGGAEAGGELPADWPDENFPVPPGVNVTARQSGGDTGILLVGRSPEEITSFYRSALPAAGYQITQDASVGGQVQVVGIEFTGNGYDGKIAVVSRTVSISLHQS
jgi:hypothetical protein